MAYRGRNYRWVRKYTVPQRVSVVRGGSGGYRGGGNGFRGYGGRNCDCQCHRELKQCCLSADAHANPSIPRCTQAPPKSATNLIAPPQERSPNYYVLVEANENAQVPTNFTSGTMGTPETCPLCQGSVYQLPGHNANPGVMYTIGQGHTLINPSLPASTIVSP
ncbi:uncharacterized protein LOC119550580 isoform X2 [Drosophila subpulchrella]|uniref:uncharacterized protein LOC119550580 isoform X2 n=1 Tax=Drosophila subpulchrella TaxID=1486046 RepID=UPI0018A1AA29|nr:uncharacterized protein LOC119550580 isoform X2 [Drosophila subpulchrella]